MPSDLDVPCGGDCRAHPNARVRLDNQLKRAIRRGLFQRVDPAVAMNLDSIAERDLAEIGEPERGRYGNAATGLVELPGKQKRVGFVRQLRTESHRLLDKHATNQ